MLLAADIGGTKTLVGQFTPDPRRPVLVRMAEFRTLDFASLEAIITAFRSETGAAPVRALCAGAAGPVIGGKADLTNVPWTVDVGPAAALLGGVPAELVNDLEATAYGVTALNEDEIRVLQHGSAVDGANAAIIAAGTGLGEALLIGADGQFLPRATESGHADFAARTPREMELVSAITGRYGRASVEHVVSGQGIANLFHFTHQSSRCASIAEGTDDRDLPAKVSESALARACPRCVEALEMFVDAYGAEAGNLALHALARAGLYVAGGIAPKILPLLEDGRFMNAFLSKPPMDDLLRAVPVRIVLNQEAALLGAAVRAGQLLDRV